MSQIEFGVWAPVHGPRAAAHAPQEPYDASWEHNRATVLEAVPEPRADEAFIAQLQKAADWLVERKVLPEKVTVTDLLAKV